MIEVAESPDGKWIGIASMDRSASLFNADTGLPRRPVMKHGVEVTSLAFAPNSSLLATGTAGGESIVWQVSSQHRLWAFAHSSGILQTAIGAGGTKLVTAAGDGTITVTHIADVGPIPPRWPAFLEGLAGQRVQDDGESVPVDYAEASRFLKEAVKDQHVPAGLRQRVSDDATAAGK